MKAIRASSLASIPASLKNQPVRALHHVDEKGAGERRIEAQQGGNLGHTLFFSIKARGSGGDGGANSYVLPSRKKMSAL